MWLEIIMWIIFALALLWMVIPLSIYFCTRMGVIGWRRGNTEDITKDR